MNELIREISGLNFTGAASLAFILFIIAFSISVLISVFIMGKNERIAGMLRDCCRTIASKFKQLRTTAVVFGVMLTIIILSLLNNDNVMKGGEDVPNAFWIAFGVVLSAFATAIAKLVEDTDDKSDQPRLSDMSRGYRQKTGDDQKPDDKIWHSNPNCTDWPRVSYQFTTSLPKDEKECTECQTRNSGTK